MEIEAQHGDTYLLEAENPVEMARLIDLDRITTRAMGGPLSGVKNLPEEAKVLDLACGPGGWVLDVAFARPDCEVAGVDVSRIMIDYANARARTQKLFNTSFGVMDITEPLDFSDQTFDLVNARLLSIVLRRESWEPFLAECIRILKPGGTLRLTEALDMGITNSVAHEKLMAHATQVIYRNGYGFSVDGRHIAMDTRLPAMLRELKYQHVHCLAHTLEFSAGCEAWADMFRNLEASYAQTQKYFSKMLNAQKLAQKDETTLTVEELERLWHQVFIDLRSPDFCGMWHIVTVLGEKP